MKTTIFTRFSAAAMMLAAVACQREDMLEGGAQNGSSAERVPLTIHATLEDGCSKTALQAGGKVYWENGDAMTVLAVGDDAVTSYKFTTTNEGAEATFSNAGGVTLAKDYYVVYPHTDAERLSYLAKGDYEAAWKCTVEDSKLRVYFPSMQKLSAAGESATALDAYSVGVVAEDGTVALKNLGGLIKINIPVEGVEHVILYGNADETIAGNAYVTFGEDGLPVISSVEGSNMVRVVPASGSTFVVGDYYINVLPVTFSDGLTVLFTKTDGTWAQVRSSGEFVVERSKVSELPQISSLTFGGKVVDVIARTDAGSPTNPFKEATSGGSESGSTHKVKITTWTLANSTHVFKIYCTKSFYRTSNMGLNIGATAGDYLEFPAIENCLLNKVVIRTTAYTNNYMPGIVNGKNKAVVGCNTWESGVDIYGLEHVWSFMSTKDESYRINTSKSWLQVDQIRLYYADATDGTSSIKPLITSVVTSEPETDPSNSKATLSGSFTAVDYSASTLTCGFDYKTVSAEDWTSVTCAETASDFSYELAADSDEDYVYRAWAKVNKTGKTVYGDEIQFNARKLVLHLVFDENRYETGYNFLWDTWHWGTNTNSKDENPNGATYNYTYNGVNYPFTFWAYRVNKDDTNDDTNDNGGYAIWANGTKKIVHGLALSYGKNISNSMPAWMQMPSADNMKLVGIDAEFCAKFPGTISSAVNEDGTATGTKIASFADQSVIHLELTGTAKDTRYYFCTTYNDNPTLRNLTLTYLYVGE